MDKALRAKIGILREVHNIDSDEKNPLSIERPRYPQWVALAKKRKWKIRKVAEKAALPPN